MAIIILLMACALSSVLVSLMLLMGAGVAWAVGTWFAIMTCASSLIVWRGLTAGSDPTHEAEQIVLDMEALESRENGGS